ncbi:MAG: type II secretion system protein [Planctomycetes bacterium]|nr:type II secretion system protein [Planctomycetota bacterium]
MNRNGLTAVIPHRLAGAPSPGSQCSSRRGGVTLVELLVVITIMLILMSMGSYAAWRAYRGSIEKSMRVSLAELHGAMTKLTTDGGGKVPPSNGGLSTATKNAINRSDRFMDYVRTRWPKQKMPATYSALRTFVLGKYVFVPRNCFPLPGSSERQGLDIDTMDQAEALVFWLGGFPNVLNGTSSNYVSNTKLIGFSNDPSYPFRLDSGVGNQVLRGLSGRGDYMGRNSPDEYVRFDEAKLVDYDQDGWLEYAQETPKDSNDWVPPYAYFDGPLYSAWLQSSTTASFNSYPSMSAVPPWTGLTASQGAVLAGQWGVACPYATSIEQNNNPIKWVNAFTFQIICAGLDRQYGDPSSPQMRIPLVPAGNTVVGGKVTPGLSDADNDNLTNFADQRIQLYNQVSTGQ